MDHSCEAPPSMEFSRQEYWNGLPFPSPGDLPDPRMEPRSPASAGRVFTTELPGKPDTPLQRLKSQVLAVSHAILSVRSFSRVSLISACLCI